MVGSVDPKSTQHPDRTTYVRREVGACLLFADTGHMVRDCPFITAEMRVSARQGLSKASASVATALPAVTSPLRRTTYQSRCHPQVSPRTTAVKSEGSPSTEARVGKRLAALGEKLSSVNASLTGDDYDSNLVTGVLRHVRTHLAATSGNMDVGRFNYKFVTKIGLTAAGAAKALRALETGEGPNLIHEYTVPGCNSHPYVIQRSP